MKPRRAVDLLSEVTSEPLRGGSLRCDVDSLPNILNPSHLAKMLGVTTKTIDAMCRNGKLPPLASCTSRKLRWFRTSVKFWLDNDKPNREAFRALWAKRIES